MVEETIVLRGLEETEATVEPELEVLEV